MTYITIKKGSTLQKITSDFTFDGAALDLSGATVILKIKNRSTGTVVERTATITDATAGEVEYQLTADDTGTAGRFFLEWQITTSDSKVAFTPEGEYIYLYIVDNLE